MFKLTYKFYKFIIKAWILFKRLKALYIIIKDYKSLIKLIKVFINL